MASISKVHFLISADILVIKKASVWKPFDYTFCGREAFACALSVFATLL